LAFVLEEEFLIECALQLVNAAMKNTLKRTQLLEIRMNRNSRVIFTVCHLLLGVFLLSCSHEPPTEAPRDNSLDGRNPEVVPKLISVATNYDDGFTNVLNPRIFIETEAACMVRFEVVQSVNSEISSHWEALDATHIIDLSGNDGVKLIGCQALALNGNSSDISHLAIRLDTHAEIISFDWIGTGEDTLGLNDLITFTLTTQNDALGNELGGTAIVDVVGWEPIELIDNGDGKYSLDFTIIEETPLIADAQVRVSFTDRAENIAQSVLALRNLTVWWVPVPGAEKSFPLGNSGESIDMCWIPSGEFMMGRQNGEHDSYDVESPLHQVSFSDGFWIGKYEVSQDEWEAVMNENPSQNKAANHPVEMVSWIDIQVFESIINESFRLPSESEWEYACRAGTTTRFYWGDDEEYDEISNYAVFIGNNSGNSTQRSGQKQPNAWGLYDMSGNVYEWCEDWYHNNYDGAPNDGSARLSPSRTYRVGRGGSWRNYAIECRSAFRNGVSPHNRSGNLGFRLVKDR
jgi:formylglycine-generating enzyme required for sulfatase activity